MVLKLDRQHLENVFLFWLALELALTQHCSVRVLQTLRRPSTIPINVQHPLHSTQDIVMLNTYSFLALCYGVCALFFLGGGGGRGRATLHNTRR